MYISQHQKLCWFLISRLPTTHSLTLLGLYRSSLLHLVTRIKNKKTKENEMATHGSIGEFNSGVEDWVSYSERLEHYFGANGIGTNEAALKKRTSILLTCCSPAAYQPIRNLTSPGRPTDKTFPELVTLVKEHHQPTPSITVQRFNFHTRVQKPGENMDFVAQLRKLSEHCGFGDTLDDMLRDRIVCGCRDTRLQCKLLASETGLNFAKAFAQAKAMEAAEREAKNLQTTPSSSQVHSLCDNSGTPRPPQLSVSLSPDSHVVPQLMANLESRQLSNSEQAANHQQAQLQSGQLFQSHQEHPPLIPLYPPQLKLPAPHQVCRMYHP